MNRAHQPLIQREYTPLNNNTKSSLSNNNKNTPVHGGNKVGGSGTGSGIQYSNVPPTAPLMRSTATGTVYGSSIMCICAH